MSDILQSSNRPKYSLYWSFDARYGYLRPITINSEILAYLIVKLIFFHKKLFQKCVNITLLYEDVGIHHHNNSDNKQKLFTDHDKPPEPTNKH